MSQIKFTAAKQIRMVPLLFPKAGAASCCERAVNGCDFVADCYRLMPKTGFHRREPQMIFGRCTIGQHSRSVSVFPFVVSLCICGRSRLR
jgi:hypothetical protein